LRAVSKATCPALAKAIGDWFPELGGRSLAVSEADITPENIPKLPLVMVGLIKETADNPTKSNREPLISEDISVQFWVETEKHKLKKGGESPFWKFHDYEPVRNKLISLLRNWKSPWGYRISYQGMDLESTAFAVMLNFQFKHEFVWCDDADQDEQPSPIVWRVNMAPFEPSTLCPTHHIAECKQCDYPAAPVP
jgi:hypothetical protein